MKKQRFTEEQIIGVLQEQEAGAKAADLCRKHGISESVQYSGYRASRLFMSLIIAV
ncbi:Transposase [Martelella mediterranea DSM 17316]|uniref:Transposase n=1 Tax=Martelella mediterranea DSM 17316 TaxID=1122214 RepID=A0A1U9YZT4_9HYPH|nr:Transposase [Martelella mediterranea DSM 17316]